MSRIPRQSHRAPAAVIPLDSWPLRKPLAPEFGIYRQRKQSGAERLGVVLGKVIPGASDLRKGVQALVGDLVAERDCRRPGPSFRSLVVGSDMDWGVS